MGVVVGTFDLIGIVEGAGLGGALEFESEFKIEIELELGRLLYPERIGDGTTVGLCIDTGISAASPISM